MGIRSRIISHLSEGMINYPEINALWLEGSDGTSTSDHLSDIDLVIHVNSGFETKALSICENLLEEIAALDLSYEEPRQHPNMRYKVFHLENTPSYLFIDVNVYSHRPYIEFDRFNDSEVPIVLFDKKQVIQIREHNESELKQTLRNRLYHLENTIKQKARIEKYIERNKFIEAIGYYHKFMISPLVEVLRIKYKPINHDYYIVCISKHLPREIVGRLEDLYKVTSIEDISKHTQQAYQWFYEVLKDVQNNLNK